jgi:hypothetical protein
MIYLNKYFKIPGPKDLGMSTHNRSMAINGMRNYVGEATWEDYYSRVKKDYPVRYFLASTIPSFIRSCWLDFTRKPKDIYYYLKCHLIKKHRYHLIDIRQPKTENDPMPYRYGWMDTDHKIEYAMMNLLVEFVEKEVPHGYLVPTEEEAEKDDGIDYKYAGFKKQLDNYKEYMAIYNYWKTERFELDKKHDDLLHAWSKSRTSKDGERDNPETKRLWKDLQAATDLKDQILNEMLIRLIKIRHVLWT